MTTFLEACQDFVSEVGVAGGVGPPTVHNQQSALGRVVQFIREADTYVNGLWPDWDWLYEREETSIAPGEREIPLPVDSSEIAEYDVDGMYFQSVAGTWYPGSHMDWLDFRPRFEQGSMTHETNSPTWWTDRPDRRAIIDNPAKRIIPVRYDYWRVAPRLTENNDPILIPFPRIVVVRAKIIYAERENAPEVMMGSDAEYSDLLQRLESRYASGSAGGRMHETRLQAEWQRRGFGDVY